MSFLRRQVVTAALTANALNPLPGFRAGIPSFFMGWLTTELAPHLLTVTAVDAVTHAPGRPAATGSASRSPALSAAGLGYLVSQSRRVRHDVEQALAEGLGVDYVEQLDEKPTPADLATPWRRLINPFRMRDPRVRGRQGHPLQRRGQARAARHLPPGPRATT